MDESKTDGKNNCRLKKKLKKQEMIKCCPSNEYSFLSSHNCFNSHDKQRVPGGCFLTLNDVSLNNAPTG